jgi:hypothetical protein
LRSLVPIVDERQWRAVSVYGKGKEKRRNLLKSVRERLNPKYRISQNAVESVSRCGR